jgi:hypothetical protein
MEERRRRDVRVVECGMDRIAGAGRALSFPSTNNYSYSTVTVSVPGSSKSSTGWNHPSFSVPCLSLKRNFTHPTDG